ncbi:hypothetical protein PT110_06950 [Erysipelothrix rhusiopathiae]|nr:hypothetical protein [Erysipelothrix rhusiopathiae]
MKDKENTECFTPFDFKRYEAIENFAYIDLHKVLDLIDDRLEVLWEYTWIDGCFRASTEEELVEWNKLSRFKILVTERMKSLKQQYEFNSRKEEN